MSRLCCYSLHLPPQGRPDLMAQLSLSVASLRRFNRDVDMVLFAYSEMPEGLLATLATHRVRVWPMGSYPARLARHCPVGAPYLAAYPLLHKGLNFAEITALAPDQVMLLDCDTLFQGNVAGLFERHAESDLVAREEVNCRRSRHGYDPAMVDEDALALLYKRTGGTAVPPFNLGVILLNNGIWCALAGLTPLFVSYAWRLYLGMASAPPSPDSSFDEGVGVEDVRRALGAIPPADRFLALRHPSENRWIVDEVALWLTLGHLTRLRTADFDVADVRQNCEFEDPALAGSRDWTVCHYFSQNFQRINEWAGLSRPEPRTGGPR